MSQRHRKVRNKSSHTKTTRNTVNSKISCQRTTLSIQTKRSSSKLRYTNARSETVQTHKLSTTRLPIHQPVFHHGLTVILETVHIKHVIQVDSTITMCCAFQERSSYLHKEHFEDVARTLPEPTTRSRDPRATRDLLPPHRCRCRAHQVFLILTNDRSLSDEARLRPNGPAGASSALARDAMRWFVHGPWPDQCLHDPHSLYDIRELPHPLPRPTNNSFMFLRLISVMKTWQISFSQLL